MFHVNLWGSDPALENDDCWTGDEFATLEEAEAWFADPFANATPLFLQYHRTSTAFIELDGPGVYRVRSNPAFVPSDGRQDAWAQESRMQAAMAFGTAGWNDYEGQ